MTLSGSAPLPPASKRQGWWRSARGSLGEVEVVDRDESCTRRAAAVRQCRASLLLDQIGKLKDGKITLTDTKVNLSGMARDLGGREADRRRR